MINAVQNAEDFGEQSFMARAIAVVHVDGVDDGIAVIAYKCLQLAQIGATFLQAGVGVGQIGCTLQQERGVKVVADQLNACVAVLGGGAHRVLSQ